MSHEQMMEKAWRLIGELGITEDKERYESNAEGFYLVENIHAVRDAFYSDLENGVEIEEEDVCGFLDRHNIKWE